MQLLGIIPNKPNIGLYRTVYQNDGVCACFSWCHRTLVSLLDFYFVFLCFVVCFHLHIFFRSLLNQGRLCLKVVRRSGTYSFMMLMSFMETRFHLSLTVMFWCSCLKSSRGFLVLRWSALLLKNNLCVGRCLSGQEVSINDGCALVCYSVYYISFLQKITSRILLASCCLCMSSLTCWISLWSSTIG